MKVLVQFSGGKDSQACLIWAVLKYGAKSVIAVFCDTGWENEITYNHIRKTVDDLGVKLVILKNEKFDGMIGLAEKKKRFPSTKARFCTEELKSKPFIDYVLSQNEHLLIIQGIRAQESHSRSKMSQQCRYFKFYFHAYGHDKNGKPKFHSYRKKEIIEWCNKYEDEIYRPVFDWSGQQVIDYIIENGQEPNELYAQGFKRVGCFPCIMSGQKEVSEILKRYPERFDEIIREEERIGSSFFKIDFVPERNQTGFDEKSGKKYTKGVDVKKYLEDKNQTIDLFEDDKKISCSSYYNLCE